MWTRSKVGHGTGRALEVADIFRVYGKAYRQTHRLSDRQLRVMRDIEACRTASLGGHMTQCDHCGAQEGRYHSCRNRHCPKCQTLAKVKWVEARQQELLPVPYFHCVFTLPHRLNALAQDNPRVLYGLLFQNASETLQTFGRDPKWLGGELGITMVLHTWNQVLESHIHVHCVVTGGALTPDHDRWIATKRRDFLFPVKALSKVFRSKYLSALEKVYQQGELQFTGPLQPWREPKGFERLVDALFNGCSTPKLAQPVVNKRYNYILSKFCSHVDWAIFSKKCLSPRNSFITIEAQKHPIFRRLHVVSTKTQIFKKSLSLSIGYVYPPGWNFR